MKLHVAALATLAVVCVLVAGSEAAPKAMSDPAVAKAQLFPDAFWESFKNVSAEFKKMVHGLHKIRENVSKMYQVYVESKQQ